MLRETFILLQYLLISIYCTCATNAARNIYCSIYFILVCFRCAYGITVYFSLQCPGWVSHSAVNWSVSQSAK